MLRTVEATTPADARREENIQSIDSVKRKQIYFGKYCANTIDNANVNRKIRMKSKSDLFHRIPVQSDFVDVNLNVISLRVFAAIEAKGERT